LHGFCQKAQFLGVYSLRYLTALSTLETAFAFSTKTKRCQQNLLQRLGLGTDSDVIMHNYLNFSMLQPDKNSYFEPVFGPRN